MKYSFSSMLGAVLLFSGVFAFSACGNDESYPDSTVTIAMANSKKSNLSMTLLILYWIMERNCGCTECCTLPGFEDGRAYLWKL